MRQLKPRQSFYRAVHNWIMEGGLAERWRTPAVCDGVRYNIPHAAKYHNDNGVTYALAVRVQVQTVLGATSVDLRKERLIGDRTMELLGMFLRAHGAKLADGWDGSWPYQQVANTPRGGSMTNHLIFFYLHFCKLPN